MAAPGLSCGMWDLPRPGLEPVSPALAGGFLTTVPPRKPATADFDVWNYKSLGSSLYWPVTLGNVSSPP